MNTEINAENLEIVRKNATDTEPARFLIYATAKEGGKVRVAVTEEVFIKAMDARIDALLNARLVNAMDRFGDLKEAGAEIVKNFEGAVKTFLNDARKDIGIPAYKRAEVKEAPAADSEPLAAEQ